MQNGKKSLTMIICYDNISRRLNKNLLKHSVTNGGLAQLGEHLPCKQGVASSNLAISISHSERNHC